ncbi:hypothetical protein ACQJBY_072481 [Aegilops geniculata]
MEYYILSRGEDGACSVMMPPAPTTSSTTTTMMTTSSNVAGASILGMKHTSPVNTGFTHNHRKSLQPKLTCESRFGEAGEEEGYQRLEENESMDCEPSIPIAGEPSIPSR